MGLRVRDVSGRVTWLAKLVGTIATVDQEHEGHVWVYWPGVGAYLSRSITELEPV